MRIIIEGEASESKRLVLEVVASLLAALPLRDVMSGIRGERGFIELSLSLEDENMLADFLEMRKSQRKN